MVSKITQKQTPLYCSMQDTAKLKVKGFEHTAISSTVNTVTSETTQQHYSVLVSQTNPELTPLRHRIESVHAGWVV